MGFWALALIVISLTMNGGKATCFFLYVTQNDTCICGSHTKILSLPYCSPPSNVAITEDFAFLIFCFFFKKPNPQKKTQVGALYYFNLNHNQRLHPKPLIIYAVLI